MIVGPGIPAGGVLYWFATENEAQSFIENLNLSYVEAREFAKWRKSAIQGRMTGALRNAAAAASVN